MKKLEDYVRSIPDFPEEGIIFRDITSVLQDADGLHLAIDSMQDLLKNVESRYLLVNLVAHRARQIAAEAEAFQEELPEKPVTLAIQEVADGKLTATVKDIYKN